MSSARRYVFQQGHVAGGAVPEAEVRALDVIGYSIIVSKHRRGQLVSQ